MFVVYLQAFAEQGVIQMALVAFYRQLLGTLCPSVFVFTHYPFSGFSISAFWLNSNFSICFVWFLSLSISNFLPELANFLFSFNLVINYYSLFFLACLIVAIITVDLWYFLVASTCVQQKKNVGLIFLILQRYY